MPKTATPAPQPQLARAVCGERLAFHVCTLLAGHAGKHTSSKGRQWAIAAGTER